MRKIYLLNSTKFDGIENIPIFKIDYISSEIDLSKYDGVIFTSKNAIYSIDSFNKKWRELDSYAIAPKTAKVIENCGGRVTFIGKSAHGDDFADELKDILKTKKVLYIRAKSVASNLAEVLRDSGIDVDELITYKTSCNDVKSFELEDNSIVIFSSPSTIECFFQKFRWKESLVAVAIGETTAKSLPKNLNFHISEVQSLEECVKLARNL